MAVSGKPANRNYALFLVVEETLISGQKLHTVFPMPMNNQITEVPKSFFEQEAAAWKHARDVVLETNRRFSESRTPGLGEPVQGTVRPGDVYTSVGVTQMADYFKSTAPDLVRKVQRSMGRGSARRSAPGR